MYDQEDSYLSQYLILIYAKPSLLLSISEQRLNERASRLITRLDRTFERFWMAENSSAS
jgi:hypothetical protein